MKGAEHFDRRIEIAAFERDGASVVVAKPGPLYFAITAPMRPGVERWLGVVHVVDRLRGKVTLARVADSTGAAVRFATPPHYVIFGAPGCRPGVYAAPGDTLLVTFEVVEPIEFVGGVAWHPLGARWFDMPLAEKGKGSE